MSNSRFSHPSYGLIHFSRSSGSSHCFMSEFSTDTYITLTIRRSELQRNLSQSWLSPKELLVKVRLSHHQFAELITSLNSGVGTPCTLEWIKGDGPLPPFSPPPTSSSLFESEFDSQLSESLDLLSQLSDSLVSLQSQPRISKKDISPLISLVSSVHRLLSENIPFISSSFKNDISSKLNQAKVDLSAWLSSHLPPNSPPPSLPPS